MRIEVLSEVVRLDKESLMAFNYSNRNINNQDVLNNTEIVYSAYE